MNNGTYSDVIYTSAFYFEKYSENQVNVNVKARVRVYTPKAGQEQTPYYLISFHFLSSKLQIDYL